MNRAAAQAKPTAEHRPAARGSGLLVSVRSVEEAQVALDAGVDLIDIKEPNRGSLGAAAPEVIRAITAFIGRRVPVSAALGELRDVSPRSLRSTCADLDWAKLGLAGCGGLSGWQTRWAQALEELPAGISRVAVVYADWQQAESPPAQEILAAAKSVGCRAVLVDTFDKRAGSLLEHWSKNELDGFIHSASRAALRVVVAGSLTAQSIAMLLPLGADYIAVRGAACRESRTGELDAARLAALVAQVYLARRPAPPIG